MAAKKARDAEYRARNREKAVARAKKWREDNPERYLKLQKDYYQANRDNFRARELMKKFGLTMAAYSEMLAAQGGVCAICAGAQSHGKSMAVDHDHETGAVRALLCDNCNRGIGLFRDSPELCRAVADYLEKHSR